ncbi:MAG: hypothetical protein ACJ8BW_30280 [Ktedonobacteraceae bacterium]
MKYREYRHAAIVLFAIAVGLYILAAMAMLFAVLSMQNLTLFSAVGKFSDVLNALMVAVLASVFGNMALAGGLVSLALYF